MPRVATLTTKEAQSLLGRRGRLKVSIDNRGNLRKWLVAHGIPSPYACSLNMRTLQAAYNDTSNKTLENLKSIALQDRPRCSCCGRTL